jgi:hypothetical protein
MELMLGLPALSWYDQNARPLYDLFQNKDQASELTASDVTAFNPVADPSFINERVADLPPDRGDQGPGGTVPGHAQGGGHPGPILEQIDWQASTNRPVPPALKQEVAKSRSGAPADDD